MAERLSGKIAWVLGAAGKDNMGQVIARRFAEEGATVIVGGRHMDVLGELADEISGLAIECDITRMEDIKHSVTTIKSTYSKLDIAVNCTGWGLLVPFEETPEEDDEPKGDDHPDAIAALKDLGARLDLNKHERVWRIFFYEQHGDDVLDQIHGLPSLKELWLLHTRVTKEGAEKARERLEGVTVHHG